jgi:hypothetical protein
MNTCENVILDVKSKIYVKVISIVKNIKEYVSLTINKIVNLFKHGKVSIQETRPRILPDKTTNLKDYWNDNDCKIVFEIDDKYSSGPEVVLYMRGNKQTISQYSIGISLEYLTDVEVSKLGYFLSKSIKDSDLTKDMISPRYLEYLQDIFNAIKARKISYPENQFTK